MARLLLARWIPGRKAAKRKCGVAMDITPDHLILFRWGFVHLNATIVYTWAVMLLLVLAAWAATRKIRLDGPRSRWQNAMEAIVIGIRSQIREVSGRDGSDDYIPFIGTLFLFIVVSNELHVVPGWHAPTGSLSTTACTGNLCGRERAHIRHPEGRAQEIPAPLLEPGLFHAADSHDQ